MNLLRQSSNLLSKFETSWTGLATSVHTKFLCCLPFEGFSGCHRFEAHQKLGLPTIRCKIRRGTKETLRYGFKSQSESLLSRQLRCLFVPRILNGLSQSESLLSLQLRCLFVPRILNAEWKVLYDVGMSRKFGRVIRRANWNIVLLRRHHLRWIERHTIEEESFGAAAALQSLYILYMEK